MLATVTTLMDVIVDDGLRSLREVLMDATAGETIDFSVSGTIELDDALGQLTIDVPLTIDGDGQITIDAGNGADNFPGTGDGFRIFNIDDGTNNEIDVTLSALTLTGGDTANGTVGNDGEDGGAILSRENLTLINSTITGNVAGSGGDAPNGGVGGGGGSGGGIFSRDGNLTVIGSTFNYNLSGGGGGGVSDSGAGGDGGAIYSRDGDLTVIGSTISGNFTRFGAGAGTNSHGEGGGVYSRGSSTHTTITDSNISNNRAKNGGGAVFVGGTATVTGSKFYYNSANGNGGGILNVGKVTITGSTIDRNLAAGGGGVTNFGIATISNSAISRNQTFNDHKGGGIANYTQMTIANSTISGNRTNGTGGAAHGGGIYNYGTAVIASSTIAGNAADGYGDGIFNESNGTMTITASIVANSGLRDDVDNGGTLSGSFNRIGDGSELSRFSHSSAGDPLIGPLADNGGATQTHALLPGSPAYNAVTGPLALYRFESNANDSAGSNNGTNNGASLSEPTEIAGSQTAAHFDSFGDFVQLQDELDAVGSSSNTVEGWVKVPLVGSGNLTEDDRVGIILGNFTATSSPNAVANWEINDEGKPRVFWDRGAGFTAISVVADTIDGQSIDLRDDRWHHLAFVRDDSGANEFRIYVDGVETTLTGTNSAGADLTFSDTHRIGSDNRPNDPQAFHGAIDELAIYDRALSPGEILARAQGNVDQRGELQYFTGNATLDIGAYEAQITPSADFDSDNYVDGVDFLLWQRGFGTANAQRADGNSDDDTDTDASDLAAWLVTYGQSPSADFVDNGVIDGADFLAWQRGFGIEANATRTDGDSNGDGDVDADDLAEWRATYGQTESMPFAAAMHSGQSAVSSPVLIDAVMSLEWLGAATHYELGYYVELPPMEMVFVVNGPIAEIVQVASTSIEVGFTGSSAYEPEAEGQSWLDDDLLERVFG